MAWHAWPSSPTAGALFSGADRTIRLWDIERGQEVHCFRGHTNGVNDVAVAPDGRRLLSSSWDGHELRLWDVTTGKSVHRMNWGNVSLTRGSFTPDGLHAVWAERWSHTDVRPSAPDKDKTNNSGADSSGPIIAACGHPRGASASRRDLAPDQSDPGALDESIPMDFANATPLNDVLTYIKQATWKGRKPTHAGIPIYVDPPGSKGRADPGIDGQNNVTGVPLNVTLSQLLGQLGVAYIVKDEVLIISSIKGIERERNEAATLAVDASPKNKLVQAMLDQPIPMSFAIAPSLGEVLTYIKQATTTPSSDGIPIFVDQSGLQEDANRPHPKFSLVDPPSRLR